MQSNATKDPAQSPPVEGGLEKLKAEYATAFEENQAAQRKYKDAVAERRRRSQPSDRDVQDSDNDARTLLNRHIELRSLQKKNTSLVVLKDELEKIKSSRHLVTWEVRPPATQEHLAVTSDVGHDIGVLEETLKRHVKALEMAVVHAHFEAKAERAKLDEARERAQSGEYGVVPEQRVRAMLTTRRYLTTWLEESLEKCQNDVGPHGDSNKAVQEPDDQNGVAVTDEMIDEQYERYLTARKRVIEAVDKLRAPLPPNEADDSERQTHKGDDDSTMGPKASSGVAMLNNIEKNLLPSLQQHSVVKAYLTLTREQLDSELRATTNMLDKLSDESQLLQAFPILARSGRFEHAASIIGPKSEAREERDGDEVTRRMKPWLFAAEAADVTLSSHRETQLGQGREAMHSVSQSLAELSLLREAT
ncbi:hypothetical protein PV08_07503 [Exophiala spinifera]|uniref:Uncharacterized protein n=1 Tax=Exophiala spinifera TaxID=91928 RepID=A0A0D2BTX4_9EURO|nr:uncharacterized protein PV08_07503 [Exophiala spinifera]KIW14719.1 hypothetical protein PV08_07503 [Exophiala spinifera]